MPVLKASPSDVRVLYGSPRPLKRWAGDFYVVANAGMFQSASGAIIGALVSDNKAIYRWPTYWPLFRIGHDGTAQILMQNTWKEYWTLDTSSQAVSCGPLLVWDGKPTEIDIEMSRCKLDSNALRPKQADGRTGLGITSDGDVLLAVFERETLFGLQQALLDAGAVSAFALDGGGSSVLYWDQELTIGQDVRPYPSAIAFTRVEGHPQKLNTQPKPQPAKALAKEEAPVAFDFTIYVSDNDETRIGRNFLLREFRCRCCGAVRITPKFIEMVSRMDALRDDAGVPCDITSGYRCKFHNKEVGGEEGSRHTQGDGIDFRLRGTPITKDRNLADRYFGHGGIGHYPNHVHVDLGPKRRW